MLCISTSCGQTTARYQWSWEAEVEVWLQRRKRTCTAFVWQQREFEGPEIMPLFILGFVAGNMLGIWAGIRKTSFCRSMRARLRRRPCGFFGRSSCQKCKTELSAADLTLPHCWCCWLACLCVRVLPLCTGMQQHLCMLLSVQGKTRSWS